MPGKVILAGEHAVVYGKMALAASIGLGVEAKVVKAPQGVQNQIIRKAIELAGGGRDLGVKIISEIPIGSGLGSSAAVSAAVIKAVRVYLGKSIRQDELFRLTMECEKITHGNPSGIDPATVVYGGLIAYRKGRPIERLQIKKSLTLLLVDSGRPMESTKEMVELVATNPQTERIVDEIETVVTKVRGGLERGRNVAEFLNQNGKLLEDLGVVGLGAMKLSNELRKLGCSVKITGAGGVVTGSGIMIVMNNNLVMIKGMLDKKHVGYIETIVGIE